MATGFTDVRNMNGEIANKAKVAMSRMGTSACGNCATWKGVNTPSTPRNKKAKIGFRTENARTARRIPPSDTMMEMGNRCSGKEPPNTATPNVTIEMSVMIRFKVPAAAARIRTLPGKAGLFAGISAESRDAPLDLSIAKAQDAAGVFEVKYFNYTLSAPSPPPDCESGQETDRAALRAKPAG
jgi:hypothetical protein